jgi:penicillin-binding protein 1B
MQRIQKYSRRREKTVVVGHLVTVSRRRRARNFLLVAAGTSLVLAFTAGAFLFRSYLAYAHIVDTRIASGYLASRPGIYAAPKVLRAGQLITSEKITAHLRRAGYVEAQSSDLWSGSYSADNGAMEIRPARGLEDNENPEIRIEFNALGRIERIAQDGIEINSYALEPELLTADPGMKYGARRVLGYQDLPPVLVKAITAIEDRRFFDHLGIDFKGILRAAVHNAGDQRLGEGGSTITQQLVKNTYLTPERTLRRKYSEAMLAFALEHRLTKQDIFALYCSEVYLGQRGGMGIRGVDQAARVYFNKEVRDLDLAEAAFLAGLIQSPARYAPERNPDAARARRDVVLNAMLREGNITMPESEAARSAQLSIAQMDSSINATAPYFVDYINRQTRSGLGNLSPRDVNNERVFTTLDLDLQEAAEQAITRQTAKLGSANKEKLQGALVAIDPKTGDVLAMVGGRDYSESQLNRATDANRQPGSVFKPIVYSAALEAGLSPLSVYQDAPQTFTYAGNATYRPSNYGGGYSMREVTMRDALVHSLNVVTVDVAMRTGLGKIASLAGSMGLQRPEAYPSLALGTTEQTPLDIAAAYSAFANSGIRVTPHAISSIYESGNQISVQDSESRQVISPQTSFVMADMLTGVVDHGTARAARGMLKRSIVAGKTGTSRDGWFVGFTPNLVVAVWIGFDNNKQTGFTGAEAALPAWTDFLSQALDLRPELGAAAFDRPAGVTFIDIDPDSGMRAGDWCPRHERIAIGTNMVPAGSCYVHLPLIQTAQNNITPQTGPAQNSDLKPNTAFVSVRGPSEVRNSRTDVPVPVAAGTEVYETRQGRRVLQNEMLVRN